MTAPYCIGSDQWNGLSKLIEEIGELQQVCGKILGSEGSIVHWSGNLNDKFVEEIGDVYAALDFFVAKNFSSYNMTRIETRRRIKESTFIDWDIAVRNQ